MSTSGGATGGGLVAGSKTPADAYANPTDALDAISLGAVWNGATWDRQAEIIPTSDQAATGVVATGLMAVSGGNTLRRLGMGAFIGDAVGSNSLAVCGTGYNNTSWDRLRTASAANQSRATTGVGTLTTAPPGNWSATATAAAGQASASQAAGGAGVRHVCTSIHASFAAGATPGAATQVNLRDGATGAGTILWSGVLDCLAGSANSISISGLSIVGSANTAMTLEFAAAGAATTVENVSLTGYDVS
jgi:hypothetical protein